MRLSDIMGHAGLAFWPQVALIIFLFVFFAVVIRLYTRPAAAYQRHGSMPLDESEPLCITTKAQTHGERPRSSTAHP